MKLFAAGKQKMVGIIPILSNLCIRVKGAKTSSNSRDYLLGCAEWKSWSTLSAINYFVYFVFAVCPGGIKHCG